MESISLKKFYEKVGKLGKLGEDRFKDPIFLDRSEPDGVYYEILNILGENKNSYFFSAFNEQKKFVLRMSYEKEKENFKENFEIVKGMIGDDKKYLLELHESAIPIQHILVGNRLGDIKIAFDEVICMSACDLVETTLKNKLEESFKNKLEWFIQFLKDLQAIHSKERLHLDIKLANLFLLDNRLKIANFAPTLTKEDFLKNGLHICGTTGHIAPELFYDRENVSPKCDILSAGIAFSQLFTGSQLPEELLKEENELSAEEQEDIQRLFGDRCLLISDQDILALFIKNYRVFNFFKHEVEKKLEAGNLSDKERNIHELLLTMIEIAPEARPDVDRLLFKVHEIGFNPESLINRKLKDRYIVQELIDGGGKGIVYKVWDPIEEVARAIKLFPPQFNFIKDGFEQIQSELRYIPHRNIVNCYGLHREAEDLNFILMEYIKGFTLKKKLDSVRRKRLREVEALSIMKQVAAGLIEAHRNGVIHRNLKDTNIMLTAEDNRIKIINFGLSLKIKRAISDTTGQDVMGSATLLVAPPEQLQDVMNEENEQTDVWGFGILLYRLLMGNIPAKNDLEKIRETLSPISGISEKTKSIIMKCLEKDRLRRYRNMVEVYEALFEEQPTPDYQELGKQEGSRKISGFFQRFKNKWVLGLTGLTFGLIAATFWLILGTNIMSGGKKYEMWYSGKPGNAEPLGGSIGYAVSGNGIKWKRDKNNPIIPHGETGSFNQFESGQSYVVHDGQYFHMLFSGSIKTGNGFEYQIGYARSENADKWTKYNIEKVILDNEKIKFPGPMLYLDGYYKMWYTENENIYYACTKAQGQPVSAMVRYSDSPILSRGDTQAWDKDGVIIGSILYEWGMYRMWYTGKSGGESKIGYATSGDGITWNKYPGNPVFDDQDVTMEMTPCVIHDSTGYKMYYTAATAGIEYYPVRLATSPDGIKWEKYPNPQVLDTGSAGWEKAKIFVTAIIYNGK